MQCTFTFLQKFKHWNTHFQWLKLNPLGANPTKWLNTLKQFVGNLPMNWSCLIVSDHSVGLALMNWICFYSVCFIYFKYTSIVNNFVSFSIWFLWSFFHFLHSNISDNKCHKQKWHVKYFTRIKLVCDSTHQINKTEILYM